MNPGVGYPLQGTSFEISADLYLVSVNGTEIQGVEESKLI